jgi:hypothetical protein
MADRAAAEIVDHHLGMRLEHGGYRVGDGNVGSKMIDHEPIIPFAIRIVQNGLPVSQPV